MSFAWTEAQRDALAEAIAKGLKRFTSGDMTTEFASLDQMRELLAEMNRQLDGAPSNRLLTTAKGLGTR